MTETMHEEEWRFMLADLRAASWVAETDPDLDARVLLKKFFAIHQFFLRNIGRSRPDLFRDVPGDLMFEVVRLWIRLYRRTLEALRERWPRQPGTADLQLAGTNWSEALGIRFEGIVRGASYASRYAEFWAERSLKCPATFASYEARMRFVGTADYWRVFELRATNDVAIIDELENGMPSFDLILLARGSSTETELRRRLVEHGWRVETLSAMALATLLGCPREFTVDPTGGRAPVDDGRGLTPRRA